MMMIKDSMVLIHLAHSSVLHDSCGFFGKVLIPLSVEEEVVQKGKEKNYADAFVVEQAIKEGKIIVKEIKNKDLVKKVDEFNIFGGEAESVALYWQEKADLLATDDDNVRKKKDILLLNLIGTPAILLTLYKNKRISKEKMNIAIKRLREYGWFSSTVLDKLMLEVK
ncbi:MAG: hypothetical protein QW331_00310 [Candidatus Woesearchaeota archaeon]